MKREKARINPDLLALREQCCNKEQEASEANVARNTTRRTFQKQCPHPYVVEFDIIHFESRLCLVCGLWEEARHRVVHDGYGRPHEGETVYKTLRHCPLASFDEEPERDKLFVNDAFMRTPIEKAVRYVKAKEKVLRNRI